MAGETTALTAAMATALRAMPVAELKAIVFPTISYATAEQEAADVKQVGYLPPWFKPLAVLWQPTDMDINVSPTATHTIRAGGNAITAALNGAQTGTPNLAACLAYTPSKDPVLVDTVAAASATAAAGTAKLTVIGVFVPPEA